MESHQGYFHLEVVIVENTNVKDGYFLHTQG
jgi:hypothetical protein